jgi:hypothetical protein
MHHYTAKCSVHVHTFSLMLVLLLGRCMHIHVCTHAPTYAGIHAEDFTPAQMCELPLDNYPDLKPVPAWEASHSYHYVARHCC